ncbi:unnamed protein product [Aureobasidium vineae]|uniref:RBR-type E3 ubiquitin transferase n=1 Tax=Aureobasidium vineae TaxID=2773715 RepID=A0A9N8PCK6_9PEZI|nr:unnamed protein product [Aureobasidium vineae]
MSTTFDMGECPICLQGTMLLVLPCGHAAYCRDCHAKAIRNLQEGEPHPSCPNCSRIVPFEAFQSVLDPEFYTVMYNRMLEWDTPATERLFCANTHCLNFIPPSAPTSSRGRQCLSCNNTTCFACKQDAHNGACAEDEGLKEAIKVSQADGGMPCPRCGTVIMRNGGCQHISGNHYGCTHEFCILCGSDWKDCLGSCPESAADADRVQAERDDESDSEDDDVDWEAIQRAQQQAELDEERLAGQSLAAEYSGRDMLLYEELIAHLHIMVIVHAEYLARGPLVRTHITDIAHLVRPADTYGSRRGSLRRRRRVQ